MTLIRVTPLMQRVLGDDDAVARKLFDKQAWRQADHAGSRDGVDRPPPVRTRGAAKYRR